MDGIPESIISTKFVEPLVWVVIAWLLNELWSSQKKLLAKHDNETEKNTLAIVSLDKTMIMLQSKIEILSEQMRPLHSLPSEVKVATEKLSKLEKLSIE